MPQKKKTITLEMTERQSNIIFMALQISMQHAMADRLSEIIQAAERFAMMTAELRVEIMEDPVYQDMREDLNPEFLQIIQAIHDPFCDGHIHAERDS